MSWNISNHEGGAMWFRDLQRHLEDAACSLIDSPCIGRTHGMIASPVVFTGIKDDDGKITCWIAKSLTSWPTSSNAIHRSALKGT